MTELQFVKTHRKEIDSCMKKHLPDLKRPNDDDRYHWIFKVVPEKYCWEGTVCNRVCVDAERIKTRKR
jgi:hypothetical protein